MQTAAGAAPQLSGLRYAVLALGDSEYAQFCGFGRALDEWLRAQGAQPLFDRVDVDNGDAAALRHWQHHLGLLAGRGDLPDWETPAYEPWRLQGRERLNPDSQGGPCYLLTLAPPPGAAPAWQAGDIAEIGPRRERGGELLPHREYSIASLPADGAAMLVRQMRGPDGDLGLGSGWLTHVARLGDEIDLRLRSNRNFHAPDDDRPMILIGNGTGLAGLRALLKARWRRAAIATGWCSASARPRMTGSAAPRSKAGATPASSNDWTPCSRATRKKGATCSTCCANRPMVRAWTDAGAAVTSAAACKAWRAAWMRRCATSWATPACNSCCTTAATAATC